MRLRLVAIAVVIGCGSGQTVVPTDPGWPMADPTLPELDSDSGPDTSTCVGLECQIINCGAAPPTTVSGTVFAPNGSLPLYDALVYVPNGTLDPITMAPGGCYTISGKPLVVTVSDAKGHFVLKDIPVGDSIPLVVQVGRWRRTFVLPHIEACKDHPFDARLPRNRSEGDTPRIAVTTGGCDPLACTLPKLGIDPQEAVFYRGADGSGPQPMLEAPALWGDSKELAKYDVVLLSSECADHAETKSDGPLRAFADAGGRILATGSHAVWFQSIVPTWKNTAQWTASPSNPPDVIDVSWPKGKVLSDWLGAVAVDPMNLQLSGAMYRAGAVVLPTNRFVYSQTSGTTTHLLSFHTPMGVPHDQQVGYVVYAGMPMATGSVDADFPANCESNLSAQEKLFGFMLFDSFACTLDGKHGCSHPLAK